MACRAAFAESPRVEGSVTLAFRPGRGAERLAPLTLDKVPLRAFCAGLAVVKVHVAPCVGMS